MMFRPLYLTMVQLFGWLAGWLAWLSRSDATETAELLILRHATPAARVGADQLLSR